MSHLDKIAALLERKKLIDAEVVVELDKLKDKSVPLDERWDIFKAFDKAGLLQTKQCGDGFIDELGHNMSVYDDFYMDRHETRSYCDLYSNRIMDDMIPENRTTQELADIWREKVLEDGYGSFEWDW